MDKTPWELTHEECRFIADAEICGLVYGNTSGLVVVPLDCTAEDTAAFLELVKSRGYVYCGLMSYTAGRTAQKIEPTPEAVFVMCNAVWKFASLVKERVDAKKQQSADWCQKLFDLQDTRGTNVPES